MDLKTQIEQLKSSFSVEGVPLINSDRFSDKDFHLMRAENTAHKYHWQHFSSDKKKWSDKEICEQIELFMSIKLIPEDSFRKIVENLLKKLLFKDKESEKAKFIEVLNIVLGTENNVEVIPEFWRNFGSAPYSILKYNNNEKLDKYRKLYGACGMDEIFGEERFSLAHHLLYGINNATTRFDTAWDNHLKDLEMQNLTSTYKSLDDLENNVVARKIKEEARKFYHDKSKPFKERLKVFGVYGEEDSCIYNPKNTDLNSIFELHTEGDMYQRHEMVDTVNIIDSWIDNLRSARLSMDWENKYHPKLKETKRNYTPSKEALNRLRVYYLEKLMLEEVRSFELDW